jgi:MFS family permease
VGERTRAALGVFGSALRNRALRRVELSYGLFTGAEWGMWIALLVFAYRHGGASASSLIAIVQLAPCAVLGPLLGAWADRNRAGRVLLVGYLVQGVTLAGVAAAIATGGPTWVVFVLAPVVNLGMTATRPAQAALVPSIVRTAEELTASNVLSGWVEQASRLVFPAVVGVLLATRGPALAIGVTAAMDIVAGLLVLGVPGPDPAPGDVALSAKLRANLSAAGRDRSTRLLLSLNVFYQALVGALDLLCVILAVSVLGLGQGGAGYLNAVVAAGGVVAGAATAMLVGRPRLVGFLTAGIVGATVALALIAAHPTVAVAFFLLALVGLSGSVFDVTGHTLLQRVAPSDALAGIFSVRESLTDFGLMAGIVVVRVAEAVGGYRAALVAPAVVTVAAVVVLWRPLRAVDDAADVPQVEIQLLRGIRIFAVLPAPALEGVARRLAPVTVGAGTVVVREGDSGDSYYAIADGVLKVHRRGAHVATLGRGEGFGEIALVHGVPRVASVTADTECLLFELAKEPFVLLLTGHPMAAREADAITTRHIGGETLPPRTDAGP